MYSQDWHPETDAALRRAGRRVARALRRRDQGGGVPSGLDVATDAVVLRKGTGGEDGYSVFTVRDPETGEEASTALERILREHGIERLVVSGLATTTA